MQRRPFRQVIETMFLIPNKKGEIVPFYLNNVQVSLHDEICNYNFLDILKFRQPGISSLIMAFFLIECMSKFCTAVMIAHDKDHTEKLLQRCRLFLDLLKGPRPSLSRLNDQEIYFSKTHSTFYIGTAGGRNFGRSATITHLHASEYAFWPRPAKLMGGLMQAVPHETGIVIKECTANGFGTLHHKQYLKALRGESKFKAIFYPWYIFQEYQSSTPLSSPLTEDEVALKKKFNLTDGQIQWRREKIEEFDSPEEFQQEYPATIEEAFLTSGGSMFPDITTTPTDRWIRECYEGIFFYHLQGHPSAGYHYILGCDVSGGTGNDYSAIQGICVETNEQVLVYQTNTLKPPSFAGVLSSLGRKFNDAFLVVEANQHGLSVLDILKQTYPFGQLYKTYPSKNKVEYGFKTTAASKYKLIGVLQKILPSLTLYDTPTIDDLRGFGETDLGTLRNIHAEHDDHVIALALACVGLQKRQLFQPLPQTQKESQPKQATNIITFEDILSRLPRNRSKGFFKSQLGERV